MHDKLHIELLPAGRDLSAWLRFGGKPDRCSRSFLWTYRWRSFWFETNWAVQERLYPIQGREEGGPPPLFVLGLWRSGTTYLHELLAASLDWSCPQTWQCFNPSAFRLRPAPGGAVALRPMDAVEIHTQSPQEDEFVLLARGADSAYRFFLDPRRWRELMPAVSFERWRDDTQDVWTDDLRCFLAWCDAGRQIPLVVKSPGHVFRAAALRRAWPDAKRIWIVRDPLEAWHSNLRMWRSMVERYALWRCSAADLTDFLSECFRAYSGVLEHVLACPRLFVDAVTSYQSLVDAPESSMRTIIEGVALSSSLAPQRLAEAIVRYARPASASDLSQPSANTLELLDFIRRQHQALLQEFER